MSTDDFFRARLETMTDLRHPLGVLAQRMPWREIEAAIAPLLAHKDRAGKTSRTQTCSARLLSWQVLG